jgi:DNA-binding MarR family transcriptional regulator
MEDDEQAWQQEHMVRAYIRTARAMRRHIKSTIVDVPGGMTAWWVLRHLDHTGPQPQVEMAREIGVPSSTLTARLEQMERDSLITRLPDAEDKRRMVVALTEAGQAVRRGHHDGAEADLAALLAGADTWDLDALRRVTLVIQHNLRVLGTDPEKRGGGRGRAKRAGFGAGGNDDPDELGMGEH